MFGRQLGHRVRPGQRLKRNTGFEFGSGPGLLDSLAAVLRWIRFGSLCRHVFNIRLHWCLVTKR